MSNIELLRDCELWVDFDTDYFDAQRNRIRDRSGNGRHPEASGGPTLGADGPDDFEAASFDGTDDSFEAPFQPVSKPGITVSVTFRPDTFNNEFQRVCDAGYTDIFLDNGNEFILAFLATSSTAATDSSVRIPIAEGEFVTVTQRYTQSGLNQITSSNGEFDQKDVGSDPAGSETFKVAESVKNNNNGDITVSFVGFWSRALSDAEIEQLNRLTAARGATL